jgi:DNA-binding NtrC family response regulator
MSTVSSVAVVARSDRMRALLARVDRIARSDTTVLLVGETGVGKELVADVRLVSASKVDLRQLVQRGVFRADLFYRLNVFPVEIPPLRDRREDVPLLVSHFLRRFAPDRPLRLSPEAERALVNYDWPGNVRELRNVVQRIALFADGEIGPSDLPPEITGEPPVDQLVRACTRCLLDGSMSFTDVVACLESNLLRQALAEARGNRTQAARLLGLSLSTLRDKLKKYGLDAPGEGPPDA